MRSISRYIPAFQESREDKTSVQKCQAARDGCCKKGTNESAIKWVWGTASGWRQQRRDEGGKLRARVVLSEGARRGVCETCRGSGLFLGCRHSWCDDRWFEILPEGQVTLGLSHQVIDFEPVLTAFEYLDWEARVGMREGQHWGKGSWTRSRRTRTVKPASTILTC